jgi:hypothetical protein
MTSGRGRALVIAGAVQLVVSVTLLLVASTTPADRLPRWGGPVDVVLSALPMAMVAWERERRDG